MDDVSAKEAAERIVAIILPDGYFTADDIEPCVLLRASRFKSFGDG